MCDIMLFDEEGDRHVIISWELALKATMVTVADAGNAKIGGEDAKFSLSGGPAPKDADMTNITMWANLAKAWSMWNTEAVTGDGAAFKQLLTYALAATSGSTITVPAENLDDKSKQYNALMAFPMPVITICRPFLEHLMHSCILTVAGRDTGATLFGPADSAPTLAHACPRLPTALAAAPTLTTGPAAAQCNCRQTRR